MWNITLVIKITNQNVSSPEFSGGLSSTYAKAEEFRLKAFDSIKDETFFAIIREDLNILNILANELKNIENNLNIDNGKFVL